MTIQEHSTDLRVSSHFKVVFKTSKLYTNQQILNKKLAPVTNRMYGCVMVEEGSGVGAFLIKPHVWGCPHLSIHMILIYNHNSRIHQVMSFCLGKSIQYDMMMNWLGFGFQRTNVGKNVIMVLKLHLNVPRTDFGQ